MGRVRRKTSKAVNHWRSDGDGSKRFDVWESIGKALRG